VAVGELLAKHLPELASGELEIVAIACTVGEMSKARI
jgi:hypothetical protein